MDYCFKLDAICFENVAAAYVVDVRNNAFQTILKSARVNGCTVDELYRRCFECLAVREWNACRLTRTGSRQECCYYAK